MNLGCLAFLVLAIFTLFAGYPLITFFTRHPLSSLGGFNIGGINSTGQIPSMSGNWGLIDSDTPEEAMTLNGYRDSTEEFELVFSDEFNTDGRSFYPGDDPYWEAVDLNYWQTKNLEWYDPAAITTKNGSLTITLSQKQTHGLDYQGGMMTTWNKFCFTGGILLASVMLPGDPKSHGLWPAVWSMGNLGRAGYGASLEGLWPYVYDDCDVGTVHNQSVAGKPEAAQSGGDPYNGDFLSFLPGQRLSRCTCPGESHPGPMHADGTFVGRSSPEIDVFEATVEDGTGMVSQSAQWAPFDAGYLWQNTSDFEIIEDPTVTQHNTYQGGVFQEATSGISITNQSCYERLGNQCYTTYGFEYKPGYDKDGGYISWINNDKLAWTLLPGAVGANQLVEISARPISQEPMYLIANLGISEAFGGLDPSQLTFPSTMSIDWIRVYQPKGKTNIGCDPPDFPTAAYIAQYQEAYTNPNLTTWQGTDPGSYGQSLDRKSVV